VLAVDIASVHEQSKMLMQSTTLSGDKIHFHSLSACIKAAADILSSVTDSIIVLLAMIFHKWNERLSALRFFRVLHAKNHIDLFELFTDVLFFLGHRVIRLFHKETRRYIKFPCSVWVSVVSSAVARGTASSQVAHAV